MQISWPLLSASGTHLREFWVESAVGVEYATRSVHACAVATQRGWPGGAHLCFRQRRGLHHSEAPQQQHGGGHEGHQRGECDTDDDRQAQSPAVTFNRDLQCDLLESVPILRNRVNITEIVLELLYTCSPRIPPVREYIVQSEPVRVLPGCMQILLEHSQVILATGNLRSCMFSDKISGLYVPTDTSIPLLFRMSRTTS